MFYIIFTGPGNHVRVLLFMFYIILQVQRTMLELINQLDGFDPRGNIKVLMATNRPDTLDPALMRPGRLDRKVEFGLPDLEVWFGVHGLKKCQTSRHIKSALFCFSLSDRAHLKFAIHMYMYSFVMLTRKQIFTNKS